jgi:hypothetical protein
VAHVRKTIREYFGTQLTGLATTGNKVFESRVYPMQSPKLPAILIYTTNESSEESAFSAKRVQDRELDVLVEGFVRAVTNFDDTLDQIALEVETAILDDTTLGGLAINTELVSTEAEYSGDSEQPVGTIRLTFRVHYRTETGVPSTAI